MALAGAGTAADDGFLAWWLAELRALLPRRAARRADRRYPTTLFYRDGLVRVFEARRTGRVELGSFLLEPPRGASNRLPAPIERLAPSALLARLRGTKRLLLRLAPEHGLVARDLLPSGAEPDLRAIVAHRLDTLTPWTPEQALFDVVVAGRRPDGRIEVELAAVPRRLVERIRERLGELGIEVEAVDLGEAEGPPSARFDLAGEAGRRGGSALRIAGAGVLGFLVLIGAAWAGSEIHARGVVVAERERAAAALEARLSDLGALRDRLQGLRREAELVAERFAAAPSVLAVLDDLSRALPDEAFLSELELVSDRLAIAGYAPDAAAILPLLEALPSLEDVRFRAPSSRTLLEGPEGGRREAERFVLVARVVERRGGVP
jgi:general secretion pathway protein L